MAKVVDMPDENPADENEDETIQAILNAEEGPIEEVEPPHEESDSEEEPVESVSVDDLPDDAELWSGGPLVKQIKAWKEEYESVYVTSITYDKHIVWRTMNRIEYKTHLRNIEKLTDSGQLSPTASGLYSEEAIAELCILYPEFDRKNPKEMAGIPSIICQQVMEASGFVSLEVREL